MSLSTSSCYGPNGSTTERYNEHARRSLDTNPLATSITFPLLLPTYPLSLRSTAVLGPEDVIDKSPPDLFRHTLDLFDRLLQFVRDLRCHALEVDVIALGHIGHRRWGVNMRAVRSGSVDGRLHDLLDQSKALILSSGQKYRLFSLSGSSLCR